MTFTKFFIFLLFFSNLQAQVGINTTTPDNSSILDIVDEHKGLLIPRISLTGRNDLSTIALEPNELKPSTGLLIYNISNSGLGDNLVSKGFYYFN